MTTPGDDSRTEQAWREIVENYGERAVLPDEDARRPAPERAVEPVDDADDHHAEAPADDLDDTHDDLHEVAEVDRFRPPPAPPLPRPRTWQRGVAWSGVFVAPLLALVIGLFSIYVNPLVGWALLAWFVGGFGYLVREMPRSPRDPWDDGSRV
ncbi:hypothetical protein KDN32_07360 [Nocardioides sp. J2M5]|uniref:hypothetical protein n=1 Tax=Nocardioides palaemonis TaxID=2829810 RepID=UPI001BA45DDB|nr:hypothetical protein [Nocardioides palaemonis]MBS2937556.1 hypothetical protein [Nocardioides palaemonis]